MKFSKFLRISSQLGRKQSIFIETNENEWQIYIFFIETMKMNDKYNIKISKHIDSKKI